PPRPGLHHQGADGEAPDDEAQRRLRDADRTRVEGQSAEQEVEREVEREPGEPQDPERARHGTAGILAERGGPATIRSGMTHEHRSTAAGRSRGALMATLALTGGVLLVEVAGAFWTGSLALAADAVHMFADVGGLALALFAIWVASR